MVVVGIQENGKNIRIGIVIITYRKYIRNGIFDVKASNEKIEREIIVHHTHRCSMFTFQCGDWTNGNELVARRIRLSPNLLVHFGVHRDFGCCSKGRIVLLRPNTEWK